MRPRLETLEDRTVPSTFVVTTTADNGDNGAPLGGSLRAAILAANGDPGSTIDFDLPTSDANYHSDTGSFTISPVAQLPTITSTVTIDGYSQPGAHPNTLALGDDAVLLIELSGYGQTPQNGLVIQTDDCLIRGLAINGFAGSGILLEVRFANIFDHIGTPATGNVIAGNFIGTDVTGTAAVGNSTGVDLVQGGNTLDNRIGGTAPADRNLVSGNVLHGVWVGGLGNVVQGNYIGTTASGLAALPNQRSGLDVTGTDCLFGGTAPGAGNVISGNGAFGIGVQGVDIHGDRIEGNYIGTDATGMAALGNGAAGILVKDMYYTSGIAIGGSDPGAGNVISANGAQGITLGVETGGDLVQGNFIGTNRAGSAALPNGQDGLSMGNVPNETVLDNLISGNLGNGIYMILTSGDRVQGNIIGTDITGTTAMGNLFNGILLDGSANNNLIGGTDPGTGNVIAFNGYHPYLPPLPGVQVLIGATGDAILGNSIHDNARLGIDLNPTNDIYGGVTPNTPGGPHAGPNDLQNYPVLISAVTANGVLTISGTLNSTPDTTFRLEFYSNAVGGPSVGAAPGTYNGQGKSFLGSTEVTTDDAGNASFTFSPTTPLPAGETFISSTATDPGGNTSEFSADVIANPAATSTATSVVASPNPAVVGQSVTFTATVTNTSGSGGTPTGSVQFVVDNVNYGSPVALDGNGQAQISDSALSVGGHTIEAVYSPTGTFTYSSGSTTETVLAASPVITTTSNPTGTVDVGTADITVGDQAVVSGGYNETGDLVFTLHVGTSGGQVAGTPITVALHGDGTYSASMSLSASSPVGTYVWTVTYAGDGNNNAAQDQGGASEQFTLRAVVSAGEAANQEFWGFKRGRQLIESAQWGGATGTALASWLAANWSNLFGNLAGATNHQVANYYHLLLMKNTGKDVTTATARAALSAALSVYATTTGLGWGTASQSDGFKQGFGGTGLGDESYNVGIYGAAFGVPNNTYLTVNQILSYLNSQTAVVTPGSPTTLRTWQMYGGNQKLIRGAKYVLFDIARIGWVL